MYALYLDETLAYIGSTKSVISRMRQQHSSKLAFNRAFIREYPSILAARAEERRLIKALEPGASSQSLTKYEIDIYSLPGIVRPEYKSYGRRREDGAKGVRRF